jgi:hypothetical protein
MNNRVAVVEKEWAEVWRDGRGKVEDWSWTVTCYENDTVVNQLYINNEALANQIAKSFEMR